MKNQNKISFDELMKDTFKEARIEPPQGVWESVSGNIGSQIAGTAVKSIFAKSIVSKIVASVFIAGSVTGAILGLKYFNNQKDKGNAVQEKSVIENANPSKGFIENRSAEEVNENNNDIVFEKGFDSKSGVDSKNRSNPVYQNSENASIEPGKNEINSVQKNDEMMNVSKGTPTVQNAQSLIYLFPYDSVFCPNQDINYEIVSRAQLDKVVWNYSGMKGNIDNARHARLNFEKEGKYTLQVSASIEGKWLVIKRNIYIKNQPINIAKSIQNGTASFVVSHTQLDQYKWSINGKELPDENGSNLDILLKKYPAGSTLNITVEARKGSCKMQAQSAVEVPAIVSEPFIPNVFTPTEKDGLNDCYQILIENQIFYYLNIRTRDGLTVFESNDPAECWNGKVNNTGKECPPDGYFYQLIYQLKNAEKVTKTGRIQLF